MGYSVIKDFYNRPPLHATEETPRKLNALLPFFEPEEGGSFLDIACHDGEKTIALRRRLAATRTVGIDFESAALVFARKRGIACAAVDLNQNTPLPFPDASFDCIHAGEVIEHLFSPDLLLREIARLLKPSGYAVITTPNLASWRNRIALLAGWQPFDTEVSTAYIVGNPRASRGVLSGHIRVFTAKALIELVGLHGLSIRRRAGYPSGRPVSLFTLATAGIDWLVSNLCPMLSDLIFIKVQKKGGSSAAGTPGRS
jgi:SAM-dependent methyltransferase